LLTEDDNAFKVVTEFNFVIAELRTKVRRRKCCSYGGCRLWDYKCSRNSL